MNKIKRVGTLLGAYQLKAGLDDVPDKKASETQKHKYLKLFVSRLITSNARYYYKLIFGTEKTISIRVVSKKTYEFSDEVVLEYQLILDTEHNLYEIIFDGDCYDNKFEVANPHSRADLAHFYMPTVLTGIRHCFMTTLKTESQYRNYFLQIEMVEKYLSAEEFEDLRSERVDISGNTNMRNEDKDALIFNYLAMILFDKNPGAISNTKGLGELINSDLNNLFNKFSSLGI